MNGDHIWMTYGPKNTIQSFRSIAVTTRTEKPKAKDAKETPAPALTWSKNLVATFLPNSSQLASLDQSGDFRYEEGDRQAKAERALLDQPNNIINLIGGARMWDSTGSADADKIVMNQMSGDFTAEGQRDLHAPAGQEEGRFQRRRNAIGRRAAARARQEDDLQRQQSGYPL